jgi:hypothetical protein
MQHTIHIVKSLHADDGLPELTVYSERARVHDKDTDQGAPHTRNSLEGDAPKKLRPPVSS